MKNDTILFLAILLTSSLAWRSGQCGAQEQLPVEWIAQGNVASHPNGSHRTGSHQEGSASHSLASAASANESELASGQFPLLQVPGLSGESEAAGKDAGFAGPVVTTVSSLLVVLAVFGGMVWISRRFGSTRAPAGALPEDVLKNLGSAAIDAKTRVTFLKVGQRIVVIGQTQNGEPQTLSEITDPEEVDRLANRCLGRPEIVGRRASLSGGRDYPAAAQPGRRDLAAG